MTNKELWLWITASYGPANKRKWEVMSGYSSIEEFYSDFVRGNIITLTSEEKARMKGVTEQKVRQIAHYCEVKGINIYCYDDDDFPQRFRDLFNPPSVLFVLGDIKGIDESVIVSFCGSREISEYSQSFEKSVVADLARAGVLIASGIQVGADMEASVEAVNRNAKSYAILGCGLEYEYPKGSGELVRKIAKNGAVISEYFPNHKPRRKDFHYRNRLLAAIGLGVVVVQASAKSGSLSIAEFALTEGKDIFAFSPSDVFSENYRGNIMLLRDGALPVFDANDILNEYKNNYSHKLTFSKSFTDSYSMDKRKPFERGRGRNKAAKNTNDKNIDQTAKQEVEEKEIDLSGLSDYGKQIVDALKNKTLLVDEISEVTKIDLMTLNLELTELEISGVVKALPGGRYSL
ncbi:MAG: DNA-protecting protein DprA [Ruminococcus sp.]|nr:DNA-protecting protein DprA [Ruminococcus sp.]